MLPTLPAIGLSDLRLAKSQNRQVFIKDTPRYPNECPNCGGMGSLWFQFTTGGPYRGVPPLKAGEVLVSQPEGWFTVESITYECPVCNDPAARATYLWKQCGLEPSMRGWSVDHIRGMDGKEDAYGLALGIQSTIPTPSGWYLFHGPYGRGKTGILCSLVAAAVRAGCPARYIRAVDILAEIRDTFGHDTTLDETDVLNMYGGVRLLAIDEVEKTSRTPWALTTLMSIFDTRYMRRGQVATVMATNLLPEQFPLELGYLSSRMKDAESVNVEGIEMRGEGALVGSEKERVDIYG